MVVAVQRAHRRHMVGRGGEPVDLRRRRRGGGFGEVEPRGPEPVRAHLVVADHHPPRPARCLLADRAEHPPQVGELEGVRPPPVPAVPPARRAVPSGQVVQCRPDERQVVAAGIDHALVADDARHVAAGGIADEQVGAPRAVCLPVAGEQPGEYHFGALGEGGKAGLLLDLAGLAEEAAEVGHRRRAGHDPLVHGGGELRAAGEAAGADGRVGLHHARMDRVVHLQRAAAGGVRVEREHQAWARWRATTPPLRFFQPTPRQPASNIRSARACWSGQARIDSAR